MIEKYAFSFEHKVRLKEDSNKTITEYFVPFNPHILLDIIGNGIIKRRILESLSEGTTFGDFVKKYNLENSMIITAIPDQENEDNSIWVNDAMSIDDLSMWDYLADVRAVAYAEKYGFETESNTNLIAELSLKSRIRFDKSHEPPALLVV